jgi:flagellar motor switch protein FliN/FliY
MSEDRTSGNPNGAADATEPPRINIGLFADVKVSLEARLGESPMTVDSIMALRPGAVVALTTGLADHVDLFLNQVLVARGEIVAVDGKYGVRVVEIAARS